MGAEMENCISLYTQGRKKFLKEVTSWYRYCTDIVSLSYLQRFIAEYSREVKHSCSKHLVTKRGILPPHVPLLAVNCSMSAVDYSSIGCNQHIAKSQTAFLQFQNLLLKLRGGSYLEDLLEVGVVSSKAMMGGGRLREQKAHRIALIAKGWLDSNEDVPKLDPIDQQILASAVQVACTVTIRKS